jgi:ABC-2 type transport system ATP-binding protein
MSSGQPVVQTRDLTKKYGKLVALDRLTMTVERGQILGLVGPNGAGKTTTIKILVGLARPSSGAAAVAGVDCVAGARRLKRVIGFMPDVFGSYDNMRVGEYLDFFGAAFGIPRRERVVRIGKVLDMAGAGTFSDLYLEALSHGMKQRVALARTLMHDPEVLILDEPANGLDPQARVEVRRTLLDLAEQGKTLLVTSHVLPELARICHRVAIITRGQLRAFGTLEEITRQLNPRRPFEVLLTRADQLDLAAEVIRRHAEAGAEVTPSPAEAAVRFSTSRREEQLAALLADLVGAGVGIAQFRELQTDLEEAFMTLARSDEESSHAPARLAGAAKSQGITGREETP